MALFFWCIPFMVLFVVLISGGLIVASHMDHRHRHRHEVARASDRSSSTLRGATVD